MAKVWKTVLIEDEELARQRLKRLLTPYDQIELVGEAENGAAGLNLVNTLNPDLIFLDIEMPVLNGFEMLRKLTHHPKIIFTTAYDQYAVKAFEEESVDYLLKPVSADRLGLTMKKLQQIEPAANFNLPLDLLMNRLGASKELKTLTVKLGDRIILIKLADIAFIEAEDKYVFLETMDGKRHLTEFTVTGLEDKLPASFMRINRGMILNTEHISEIRKNFNGALTFVMNNPQHSRLTSGRTYGAAVKEQLGL